MKEPHAYTPAQRRAINQAVRRDHARARAREAASIAWAQSPEGRAELAKDGGRAAWVVVVSFGLLIAFTFALASRR